MVTIEWRNIRVEVPKYRAEWDMNVQFELEEGRRSHAYLTLIGGGPAGVDAARWQLYAGGVRTNRDMAEFTDHVNKVLAKECLDDKPDADDEK